MSRRVFILAITAVVIVSFAVRVFRIGDSSLGWNQDDLMRAYDAYALLSTGADHRGNRWPIFFESFDAQHDSLLSLYQYLVLPAAALFDGPSPLATRITSIALGLMGIIAAAFLFLEITRDRRVTLLATAVLAFSPWQIFLSRFNEPIIAPAIATSAAAFYLAGIRKQSSLLQITGAMLFGLALAGYKILLVFSPALFITLIIIKRKHLNCRQILTSLVAFVVGSIPFLFAVVASGGRVLTRGVDLTVGVGVESYSIWTIIINIIQHFGVFWISPAFVTGLEAILALLGIVILLHGGPSHARRIVFAWFFLGILPASIVIEGLQIGRSATLIPMTALLAGLGGVCVLDWLKKARFLHRLVMFILALIIITPSVIYYARSGFPYRHYWLLPGLMESIIYAKSVSNNFVVTDNGVPSAIYLLVALKVPVEELRATVVRERLSDESWEEITSFGGYRFCLPVQCARVGDIVVARSEEAGAREPIVSYGRFKVVRW